MRSDSNTDGQTPSGDVARRRRPDDRVFAFEKDQDLDALKEIKVAIPVAHHLKLHALKITENRNISETVSAAVEAYFERMADESD